jgi:hypothetical protein
MTKTYTFQVGDKVLHRERNTQGVISGLCTLCEDSGKRVDNINVDVQWYDIDWNDEELGEFTGFESEHSIQLNK